VGKRGWLASTARHDRALSSGHSLSDRATLADALRRLNRAQIPLDGASDHGVSEALYLRDPDENGVELYRDRPRDQWPRSATGEITMYSRQLDLDALLAEK
jgi:catechol 2,3-dioxygenase